MERYIKMFIVALFATMSFAIVSCGDDDEPNSTTNEKGEFTFDGKNMFLRDSGALDFVRKDNIMQINFSLYKSKDGYEGDELDLHAIVGASIEVQPFDVNNTTKGTKLSVVTSRYTYVDYISNGVSIGAGSVSGDKTYFKPSGEITFVGFDKSTQTVTLNIDLTMANHTESVKLKGEIACEYTDPSYFLKKWGGEYDY